MKKSLLALGVFVALGGTAQAAAPAKTDRVDALEARIQALEANAEAARQQAQAATAELEAARAEIDALKSGQNTTVAAAPAAPPESAESAEPAPAESAGSNANAFNPAISIILNGAYANHSLDPDSYERAGFPLIGAGGPGAQGLSLGESEFSFAANIDDKFYGQVTASVESENGEDHLGIEEAYIDTTALPGGLSLRAGRFYSNIGYLNSHHAHTDKFYDRPLAYQALLGGQYGDDGVQLRWVAPTDLFLEFGGEIFRGQNTPSGGASHDGVGAYTLFAHAGGDIGSESSWLAGASMLDSDTVGGEDGFTGKAKVYIADATWKWAPQGNFKDGGFTLRGEYLVDDRNGQYIDAVDPTRDQIWDGMRRGAYIEGVYRINRNWETGYRYDRLWADNTGPFASSFDPSRNTLMLTWLNSEFSLLRLQYSHDRPDTGATDNVLSLQYQVSLGAHGAHKF